MPPAFSPTKIAEITAICLLIFTMGSGLLYQFLGWKLDGTSLIMVCVLLINYVNVVQSRLAQASARIDELEKRLSPLPQAGSN
jgi:hypothetical protein